MNNIAMMIGNLSSWGLSAISKQQCTAVGHWISLCVKCCRMVDSVFVIAYPMRLKASLVLLFPFWFNHLRVGMGNF